MSFLTMTLRPIIINDKLAKEEVSRLTTVLERHQSIFGYLLQDLKGISLTLYAHCIPIDPDSTPSREPQ